MTDLEMIQEAIAEAKRLQRGAVVKAFVPAAAEPSYTMIPSDMPAEFYQLQEAYRIAKAERYLQTSLEHATAIAKAAAAAGDRQEEQEAKRKRRSALEEALRKLDELEEALQKLADERKSREQRREAMNRAAAKRRQAEPKDDEDDQEYGYPEPEKRPKKRVHKDLGPDWASYFGVAKSLHHDECALDGLPGAHFVIDGNGRLEKEYVVR